MICFKSRLEQQLEGVLALPPGVAEALEVHYEQLLRWNQRINLTGIRDPAEIVVRHYAESLYLAGLLPSGALRLADVGSGAGFPGVPIAAYRPDCTVMLVESVGKKCVFLRQSTSHLPNVMVHQGRAESLREPVDWVVARAVRWQLVMSVADKLAASVALLIGEPEARQVMQVGGRRWECHPIPWSKRSYAVLGWRE